METSAEKKSIFSVRELAYMGIFAALIAVCSWISVPTPWDISFTLQTFAVCLTIALLGTKRGTLTVLIYILLGLVGLPVFSGFRSGVGALFGATGGYIIGFLFMGLITGLLLDRFGKSIPMLAIAMVAGLAVCYLFGTIWFVKVYVSPTGPVGFAAAFGMCVLPYLIPDCVKIALAILLTKRLAPHQIGRAHV